MNAATLVAQSRQHRVTTGRAVVDLAAVKEMLSALLGMILSSTDYEANPASAPAIVARSLAAIIASIEDSLADTHAGRLQ